MEKTAVAFFDSKPYTRQTFDQANQGYGFHIKYLPNRLDADSAPMARGYPVVCAFVNDRLDHQALDQLVQQGVQLLALRCSGFNNVDLRAAKGRLRVVRVPAYSPHAVAEHTLALILTLNRKTHKAYARTREGNFNIQGLLGFDLFDKVAGVIGTGAIGREVARILRGFGMEVLAHDPAPDPALATELGLHYVGLEELLTRAHLVTLHCPLTADSRHLINGHRLGLTRDGVMLINTSRGGLVDTPALIAGLKSGHVGYAGLDVYEEEARFFFEDLSEQVLGDDVLSRLLGFPNVLVTSHQGFFTREALDQIARTTLESVQAFVEGRPLVHALEPP
jgi:D-lactate dehydrogenase